MEQEKLVHQNRELTVANEKSLRASQRTLAVQIHLCNLNSKTEMESELSAEFDRVFCSEPAEAIAYAFSKWRDISQFVPTIADIRLLVRGWKLEQQSLKAAADRKQLEVEREKGNLVDFSEIALKLKEMAKIQQPVPQGREKFHRAVEKARAADSMPAVVLTKEELLELADPTTPEAMAKKAKDRDQLEVEMRRLKQLDAQKFDGDYTA